jgi:hypothetical protein
LESVLLGDFFRGNRNDTGQPTQALTAQPAKTCFNVFGKTAQDVRGANGFSGNFRLFYPFTTYYNPARCVGQWIFGVMLTAATRKWLITKGNSLFVVCMPLRHKVLA